MLSGKLRAFSPQHFIWWMMARQDWFLGFNRRGNSILWALTYSTGFLGILVTSSRDLSRRFPRKTCTIQPRDPLIGLDKSLRNWVILDYEEPNGLTVRPWAPFLLSSLVLPCRYMVPQAQGVTVGPGHAFWEVTGLLSTALIEDLSGKNLLSMRWEMVAPVSLEAVSEGITGCTGQRISWLRLQN